MLLSQVKAVHSSICIDFAFAFSNGFHETIFFILGIMETGSWLVLTGLENCPTELITLVSNKVALICKAKTQMSDKLMLEGAEVRINMNCAIIGVIGGNAGGYDDNRRYLRTLKAGMRPVSILQPDHKSILDVRFFLAGFENSAIFAAKIEVIFTSAKELMGNQTICQFSLDGMFAVVQQAANFKQTFGSTISPGEVWKILTLHLICCFSKNGV